MDAFTSNALLDRHTDPTEQAMYVTSCSVDEQTELWPKSAWSVFN